MQKGEDLTEKAQQETRCAHTIFVFVIPQFFTGDQIYCLHLKTDACTL